MERNKCKECDIDSAINTIEYSMEVAKVDENEFSNVKNMITNIAESSSFAHKLHKHLREKL